MKEKKYCERCGKLIGDAYETDYFAYIRMKYCSDCKAKVKGEQDAQRMKDLRRKTRELNKARKEQLELLREENEMLRRKIVRLREEEDSTYAKHSVDFKIS